MTTMAKIRQLLIHKTIMTIKKRQKTTIYHTLNALGWGGGRGGTPRSHARAIRMVVTATLFIYIFEIFLERKI